MLTPLHLEILLWYYSRANEYPFEGNGTRQEYARQLVKDGILEQVNQGLQTLRVTSKGRFWIEHILALPWPKQQWVMPTASGE